MGKKRPEYEYVYEMGPDDVEQPMGPNLVSDKPVSAETQRVIDADNAKIIREYRRRRAEGS